MITLKVVRCTPGNKFKQFDKLFDLVMLNAKLFDWLNNFSKQNRVNCRLTVVDEKKCRLTVGLENICRLTVVGEKNCRLTVVGETNCRLTVVKSFRIVG